MPVTIPDKPAGVRWHRPAPLWRRLAWFVALYLGGIGVVGAVAYGIRLWIKA